MTPTPPPIPDDSRPSPGKRTPPELKWLLNERAALAGETLRLDVREQRLANRLRRLEPLLARTRQELGTTRQAQSETSERIASLDLTMQLMQPALNPEAGGAVKAWAGRYGERGALTEFVREVLLTASPNFISLVLLRDLVIVHFELDVRTWQEKHGMRGSLRSALERLRAKGLVEWQKGSVAEGKDALWRWKPASTLDDLRALVAAVAVDAAA